MSAPAFGRETAWTFLCKSGNISDNSVDWLVSGFLRSTARHLKALLVEFIEWPIMVVYHWMMQFVRIQCVTTQVKVQARCPWRHRGWLASGNNVRDGKPTLNNPIINLPIGRILSPNHSLLALLFPAIVTSILQHLAIFILSICSQVNAPATSIVQLQPQNSSHKAILFLTSWLPNTLVQSSLMGPHLLQTITLACLHFVQSVQILWVIPASVSPLLWTTNHTSLFWLAYHHGGRPTPVPLSHLDDSMLSFLPVNPQPVTCYQPSTKETPPHSWTEVINWCPKLCLPWSWRPGTCLALSWYSLCEPHSLLLTPTFFFLGAVS